MQIPNIETSTNILFVNKIIIGCTQYKISYFKSRRTLNAIKHETYKHFLREHMRSWLESIV